MRGAAHIGVLRILQKEGIPVDYVVEQFTSFRTVFDRVMNATLEQLDEDKVHGADIVIRPELVNIPILSKDRRFVDEAVREGEKAAINALPRIRERLQQSGIAAKVDNSPALDTQQLMIGN